MTCRALFVRDHPDADLERAMMETCPHDFGIKPTEGAVCLTPPYLQDCRACWEREAEERAGQAAAPTEEG